MGTVHENSLADTLAEIAEAALLGRALPAADRAEAAAWIAARMDAPRSYRGLPAPTGRDYSTKLRLFSGEISGSHAGTGCKLGFEATWALAVLRPKERAVVRAAEQCRAIAVERFAQETARRKGMYCCYSCSVAGWRALAAAGRGQPAELLAAGVRLLKADRGPAGRWARFPFWYTVLSLSLIEPELAREELRFAAPSLERFLRAKPKSDVINRRRRLLAERALAM